MSYRGRPSKGCEPCRARKVKCDEGKPICSRCKKSGHECVYRDQADLLFRNQTASAAQRAEDSWRKRSKSNQRPPRESSNSITPPPSDESSPQISGQQQAIDGQLSRPSLLSAVLDHGIHDVFTGASPIPELGRMSMAPELRQDLRQLAFERFVYDFVSPDDPNRPSHEPSDALWTFIPTLYESAPEDSCLAIVVDAVAYVNFANRCNAPHAEALAEECIGKGIASLSKMITDKKAAASNEALCSVYLMGVYENFTTLQRKGTFIAHQHGANALLQLRTLEEYYSEFVSSKLYEVAYAQMLLGNIQSAKRPPIPIQDVVKVENFLPSLYANSNVNIVRLIWREAMLHARWHEIKQNTNPPTARQALQELLQIALELDGDFQAWEASLPLAWQFQSERNTLEARTKYETKWQNLVLNCNGAPRDIHSYPNLKRVWIWGFYRTTRVFLLRDILEIINWMFRLPECHSPVMPVEVKQETGSTPTKQENPMPARLDNMALCIYRSLATDHLVELIENSCSAIMGSFTVPIYTKSSSDVVGMRGYVCLWSLGTMDAVLSSGLVPDLKPSVFERCSSTVQTSAHPLSGRSSAFTTPPRYGFSTGENSDSYAAAPQFSELSRLSPKTENSYDDQFTHDTMPSYHNTTPPRSTTKRGHMFDSSPARPFDRPVELPPYNATGTEPQRIDVAARREWLNRMLYYIGKDLGIKKALYIPVTEGYLSKVKPAVDSILGL
ncbi:hypothetical protein ACN47E_010101 [Coniothyrium glycines]